MADAEVLPVPRDNKTNPFLDAPGTDAGKAITTLLRDLRARAGRVKTEEFASLINSRLGADRKVPKTTIDKWFADPARRGYRPPPRERTDIANALKLGLKDLNVWKTIAAREQDYEKIDRYFGAGLAPRSAIETETAAIAAEIEMRRDPVVTAETLFREALQLGPAILCVIPEAELSAAYNRRLRAAIVDFVNRGGCYAVIVPCGNPPRPTEQEDDGRESGLYDAVGEWRKIYENALTLIEVIRRALREGTSKDAETAAQRVQLVEPVFAESQRAEQLRLVRLLPPAMGPAARPWLLFAGTDPLEDPMAYTCGAIESSDDRDWTQLTVVSPMIASSLGVKAAEASPFGRAKRNQEALKRYCWDVLSAWEANNRRHLGTQCVGNTWRYHVTAG